MINLQQLRQRCLSRADMENSNFRSEDDLDFMINSSVDELYDLLVSSYEDYYVSEFEFDFNGSPDGYQLPVSIYKLLGIDSNQGIGDWTELEPYTFSDRNSYTSSSRTRYRWLGNSISFSPSENAAGRYKIYFIPRNKHLLDFDESLPPDLEQYSEYIVIDVAIKLLQQEESDPSVLMAQKGAMIARINNMKHNRDVGNPITTRKVRFDSGW